VLLPNTALSRRRLPASSKKQFTVVAYRPEVSIDGRRNPNLAVARAIQCHDAVRLTRLFSVQAETTEPAMKDEAD